MAKRKSIFGRNTINSKRMNLNRAAETTEERDLRLRGDRSRASTSRAAETTEQRDLRLQGDRSRPRASISRVRADSIMEAFNYDSHRDYNSNHADVTIGQMEKVCQYCRALKFQKETLGMCCSNGKVSLPPLSEPPEPLRTYVSGSDALSNHFLNNIVKYNSCFQMTSFGATKIIREW